MADRLLCCLTRATQKNLVRVGARAKRAAQTPERLPPICLTRERQRKSQVIQCTVDSITQNLSSVSFRSVHIDSVFDNRGEAIDAREQIHAPGSATGVIRQIATGAPFFQ